MTQPLSPMGYSQQPAPQQYAPTLYAQRQPMPHVLQDSYGMQSKRTWDADDRDPKSLIDSMRAEFLWRLTAHGQNVQFSLTYGTKATRTLERILLPLEAAIPGQVNLTAFKVDPEQSAECVVTFTAIGSSGAQSVRTFAEPGPLPSSAKAFTALTASTLVVAGIAGVVVVTGQTLPLISPTSVTTGVGIVEHVL